MKEKSNDHRKLSSNTVTVDGQLVRIPGFNVGDELGRGANAVVFKANDELLGRNVAIKVWNKRGISRAQFETAKIAQLEHPLIVRTYQFNWIDEHAYATMELVQGISGKIWLSKKPSILERIAVWRIYSAALRFIYSSGETHGDPHLGNVLVFPDREHVYDTYTKSSGEPIGVKIADMGTSRFLEIQRRYA